MTRDFSRTVLRAGLLAAAAALSACGNEGPYNRSVESVHQPVVNYATFLFDVRVDEGAGLSVSEQARLTGWLDSLHVGYGDKLAIATGGGAVPLSVQRDIADVLGRRGMLVEEDSSALPGTPPAGSVRLVMRRASASVPGCPNWRTKQESDMVNGTSSNFGCAVNGNFAAMVANPEDLVRGQTNNSDLRTATSNRAIQVYQQKAPTGSGDLKSLGN